MFMHAFLTRLRQHARAGGTSRPPHAAGVAAMHVKLSKPRRRRRTSLHKCGTRPPHPPRCPRARIHPHPTCQCYCRLLKDLACVALPSRCRSVIRSHAENVKCLAWIDDAGAYLASGSRCTCNTPCPRHNSAATTRCMWWMWGWDGTCVGWLDTHRASGPSTHSETANTSAPHPLMPPSRSHQYTSWRDGV